MVVMVFILLYFFPMVVVKWEHGQDGVSYAGKWHRVMTRMKSR